MFDPDYDLFIAIVESGSISATARRMSLSAPAVSKRLARLEERLGGRLLNRTTRRLAPTAAGRDLYDTLVPLRRALDAAKERVAGHQTQISGRLRLSAPTSFARLHVLPCLPLFIARYPAIELQVDLSDEFVDLLSGHYDLAIRIGAGAGPGLVGHRMGTSRRVLCASPKYLEAFGVPQKIGELAHHRLLATESQFPWILDGPGGRVVHHGRSFISTNSSEVVRELALGGCGLALRSIWDVDEAIASGKLVRVLDQYEGLQDVGIFMVHAPFPMLPARFQAIIDHLGAQFARIDALA
ncbi:LysR family transcriptional regulator [Sphingobium sp. B2]|uniref:LysR family transcriptional regulator n=1 Tax=Sphingobium sp. B2 TaxID=2583228 RepID=UPI0011A38AA8|nr:LysR family transcriptional regulator [Sphingobium sp. B2]